MDVHDDGGIVVLYKRWLWTLVTVVILSYLHQEGVEIGANADRKCEQCWFRFWGFFC